MKRNAKRAAWHAIRELAARPFVFSAHEVAARADLPRDAPAVEDALRMRCLERGIVLLSGAHGGARRCFLGRGPALRWWCRHNMQLARLGIDRLSAPQLQAAMALAFDRRSWHALPANLLDLGRQHGMVALSASDALVFPWAMLLQANPACAEAYHAMFYNQSPPDGLRGLTMPTLIDNALADLPQRQLEVMRKRYALDGEFCTLAQLGAQYRVTRERIRQIQNKAQRHIAQPDFQLALWWAFVADFMQNGCRLVIAESHLTAQRKFLYEMIKLNAQPVAELAVRIIGPARRIDAYRELLRRDAFGESSGGRFAADHALAFLPARDRRQLIDLERQRRDARAAKSMSRMAAAALRALGRAAHYGEIAARCNALFPQSARSTRNWHAALSRFAAQEKLGIVWVGGRGMYGLKEHGYARPAEGLYEAIARIVQEQFAATGCPVPVEAVLQALSKQRREFNPNSVTMALVFSDCIAKTNRGYMPAAQPDAVESKHDIAAAMRAFTDGQGAEDG